MKDFNDVQPLNPQADKEEEAWHSVWQHSRKLRDAGQDEEFVRTALEAFRTRPHRAEPLHDLARYYLGKSRGDIAIVFADAGMSLPLPGDRLGVEEDVYRFRLMEAFVIAASYSMNPHEKERGRGICNWLSMDRTLPHWTRVLARQNLRWFTEPASFVLPSIQFNSLSVAAPGGFTPGNISLARLDDGFVALVRAVNYDLLDSGYFDRHGDTSFRQRILRLHLDHDLKIVANDEVFPPHDLPPARHTDSLGFEDPRPFLWQKQLWSLSCLRQLNEDGRAEMVLARIANGPQGLSTFTDWRVLPSGKPKQWEKNWMPQVVGEDLRFCYSVDPSRILSESGEVLLDEDAPLAVENFRGGSQAVPFDGGWLMLIHEWERAGEKRNYFHRFIWFSANDRLARLSRRFFFFKPAYEFASGLAWHTSGDRLIASFGIDEHSPTLAVIEAQDVRAALLDIDEHRRTSGRARETGRIALADLLTLVTTKMQSEEIAKDPIFQLRQLHLIDHSPEGLVKFQQPDSQNVTKVSAVKGGRLDKEVTISDPAKFHARMTHLPSAPRTHLFTVFGTVLYVDVVSGHLRHGPIETSPANALFVADPGWRDAHRVGRLMHDKGDSLEPIACLSDHCQTVSSTGNGGDLANATSLKLIPLERGLIALTAKDLFLSADPAGAVSLPTPLCSTWECFLATEDWCTEQADDTQLANAKFDKNRIQSYLVHPLIRKRASAESKATKVLIYGYPQWSHGRIYYDLSKRLHGRGYIVDILNWQENHTSYIADLISFYDVFIAALDGVRTLTEAYGVPYDKMVALSHHELDIRMLIEQKGVEVFDKFANYGVTSEYVYCTSLMKGISRVPKVVSTGINFSEFYSKVSDRLATVGYASSMAVKTYGIEWKRGELAEAAAREAGLEFRIAGSTGNQTSFHDMPDFYRSVDAVLTSSISESAQHPVMEAAAAGRLVIGTPVGHFPRKAYEGGGILAPIEAEKFKAFTAQTLRYYKDNPAAYRDKCHAIQEAARKFDWKYTIEDWVQLIESAKSGIRPNQQTTRAR
jgi:glycosyltransferase involved in cell wall biosynthesis